MPALLKCRQLFLPSCASPVAASPASRAASALTHRHLFHHRFRRPNYFINPYRFEVPRAFELSKGGKVERFDFPLTDNFSGQTAYFSDCILNGTKPEPDGEDGLADMMIMLAIEKAAATGQSQKLAIPPRPAYASLSQLRSFPPVTHRLVL